VPIETSNIAILGKDLAFLSREDDRA